MTATRPTPPPMRTVRRGVSGFRYLLLVVLVILVAAALAGCKTTDAPPPEPIIRTVEVKVPVDDPACARQAVAELGTAPVYPDTASALRAAVDLFERVKLLLAGRELREAREAALIGALSECAR